MLCEKAKKQKSHELRPLLTPNGAGLPKSPALALCNFGREAVCHPTGHLKAPNINPLPELEVVDYDDQKDILQRDIGFSSSSSKI
jgi:hypothetical protein